MNGWPGIESRTVSKSAWLNDVLGLTPLAWDLIDGMARCLVDAWGGRVDIFAFPEFALSDVHFPIRSRMPRHADGSNPVECFESSSFPCTDLRMFFLFIDLNQYMPRQAGINLISPFLYANRPLTNCRNAMDRKMKSFCRR